MSAQNVWAIIIVSMIYMLKTQCHGQISLPLLHLPLSVFYMLLSTYWPIYVFIQKDESIDSLSVVVFQHRTGMNIDPFMFLNKPLWTKDMHL